jgi:hypothetical protein
MKLLLLLLMCLCAGGTEVQVSPDLINTETYYFAVTTPLSEEGCYKIVVGTSVEVDIDGGACDAVNFAGSPVSLGGYVSTVANVQSYAAGTTCTGGTARTSSVVMFEDDTITTGTSPTLTVTIDTACAASNPTELATAMTLKLTGADGHFTHEPTGQPTGEPSGEPSGEPTGQPTGEPSGEPSGGPSGEPTGEPSSEPSAQPSGQPTGAPTGEPSRQPTGEPSGEPTGEPTGAPTALPSGEPSGGPTTQPSSSPTGMPSGEQTG